MERKRVLYTEDTGLMQNLFGMHLLAYDRRNEIELVQARNGCKALEIIASQVIDMMILDMEMPEVSGYTVLTFLKYGPTHSANELNALLEEDQRIKREVKYMMASRPDILKGLEERALQNIPIVGLTTNGEVKQIELMQTLGINGLILKPYVNTQIYKVMDKFLFEQKRV